MKSPEKKRKSTDASACSLCRENPGVIEIEVWEGRWSRYCLPCGGSLQSVLRDARGVDPKVRSVDPKVPVPPLPAPDATAGRPPRAEVAPAPPRPTKPLKGVMVVGAPKPPSQPVVVPPAPDGSPDMDSFLDL